MEALSPNHWTTREFPRGETWFPFPWNVVLACCWQSKAEPMVYFTCDTELSKDCSLGELPGSPGVRTLRTDCSGVVVVLSLRPVWFFETPWTAARQAPLSFTISWSLLIFMSTELMMSSNHVIHPPSPPAVNLSQHQGLFQWIGSSHQVDKELELQHQHQSF